MTSNALCALNVNGSLLALITAVFFVSSCQVKRDALPVPVRPVNQEMKLCIDHGGSWIVSRLKKANQGQMECILPGFRVSYLPQELAN